MTADTITIPRVQTIECLLETALRSVREILGNMTAPEEAAAIINEILTNLTNANQ